MQAAARAATPAPRPPRNLASFERGLHLEIAALIRERDALHEEVGQLRAAVRIYTEVVDRLGVNGPQRIVRRRPLG
jgi:hypothetical protein